MLKGLTLSLGAAALAASLTGLPAQAQDKTITLGTLGAFAADAVEGFNGAKLAVKGINVVGDVAGIMLKAKQFDTKERPPTRCSPPSSG